MTEQEKEKLVELAYKAVMGQDLRPQDRRVVVNTCQRFLAAIDAERSKDAKAWICDYAGGLIRLNGFVSASQKEDGAWRALYLSPSIPDGWKPIETAPKDGTTVLLGSSDRVTIGEWLSEQWPTAAEFHSSTGEYLGQHETGECIEEGWASWDGGFTDDHPPTHWMPLPSSPEDV